MTSALPLAPQAATPVRADASSGLPSPRFVPTTALGPSSATRTDFRGSAHRRQGDGSGSSVDLVGVDDSGQGFAGVRKLRILRGRPASLLTPTVPSASRLSWPRGTVRYTHSSRRSRLSGPSRALLRRVSAATTSATSGAMTAEGVDVSRFAVGRGHPHQSADQRTQRDPPVEDARASRSPPYRQHLALRGREASHGGGWAW